MNISQVKNNSNMTIKLIGNYHFKNTKILKRYLIDLLCDQTSISLILSDVSYINLPFIQLLYATKVAAKKKNIRFQIIEDLPENIKLNPKYMKYLQLIA